jgi:hypothetical protein
MLYHHALIEKTTILGVSYLTDKPLPVTGHEAHGLSPGFNQLCKFLVSFHVPQNFYPNVLLVGLKTIEPQNSSHSGWWVQTFLFSIIYGIILPID